MGRRGLAVAGVVLAVVASFAVVLAGPLTEKQARPLALNLIDNFGGVVLLQPGAAACQGSEDVPARARKVVFVAGTDDPPAGPINVSYRRAARGPELLSASGDGGIGAGGPQGIELPPHPTLTDVVMCMRNDGEVPLRIGAAPAGAAALAGAFQVEDITLQGFFEGADGVQSPMDARMSISYEWPEGAVSPLDLSGEVARRAGMWRGDLGGSATSWLAMAAVLVAGAGGLALVIGGWSGRRAVTIVAVAAGLNGAAWAYLNPPFQVPDEVGHAAYLQYFAEEGALPDASAYNPSAQLALAAQGVQFSTGQETNWIAEREREFASEVGAASPNGGPGVGYVGNNPPLYYVLMSAPYQLGGDFYERLMVIRLATALLAALAAALAYLFVAELLPRRPVAAAAAGLAVALQPVFGFLGGGVSPDILLITEGIALLWLGARALRRGLDGRTAVGMGLLLAAAMLTKPAAIGLVPAVAAILAVVGVRAARMRHPRMVGAALAVLVVAGVLYGGYREIVAPALGRAADPTAALATVPVNTARPIQPREGLSYAWQYFLPQLGFMTDQHGGLPVYDNYFAGFVGRFGWHEFNFSREVTEAALVIAIVLLVLALHALWRSRARVRRRWMELVVLIAAMVALALVVAAAGYRYRIDTGGQPFEQVRYLFPILLPLYGGVVALAVIGARWLAVPLAAGLVTAFTLHDLSALLLTLDRYYL